VASAFEVLRRVPFACLPWPPP